MIKPQFEAGRERVGKKGIIQDPAVHREVLSSFGQWAIDQRWSVRGLTTSPIRGAEGNREFFVHLAQSGQSLEIESAIERTLEAVDQVAG